MPINYSSTAFQHDSNVQKEFERYARFANKIEEDLEEVKAKLEEKEDKKPKQEIYGLTVKHNDLPLDKRKEVQVLNFTDTETVTYELESFYNNNSMEVTKQSTEIIIKSIAHDCLCELQAYLSLILNQKPIASPLPLQKPETYQCIKVDNPGDIYGNKASEKGVAIYTNNFPLYPIPPTLSGTHNPTTYNLYHYRGLKFYNEALNLNMPTLDNTKGYTIFKTQEKGIFKIACIITAQWDLSEYGVGDVNIELHEPPAPAIVEKETIVELMVMKNGLFHSLLNAMRISYRSFHLQGEDLISCNANDEISIGFKAYSQSFVSRREINLRVGGATTHPDYTPLYSHCTFEKVSPTYKPQTNAGHTYSEEY